MQSFGPLCVANPAPEDKKEEKRLSHELVGLKLPQLQPIDQEDLSISEKSDSNRKEREEGQEESDDDDDSEKRRERR